MLVSVELSCHKELGLQILESCHPCTGVLLAQGTPLRCPESPPKCRHCCRLGMGSHAVSLTVMPPCFFNSGKLLHCVYINTQWRNFSLFNKVILFAFSFPPVEPHLQEEETQRVQIAKKKARHFRKQIDIHSQVLQRQLKTHLPINAWSQILITVLTVPRWRKVFIAPVFITRWQNLQTVVHPYSRLLFEHLKSKCVGIALWVNPKQTVKLATGDSALYDYICMNCLEYLNPWKVVQLLWVVELA